MGEVFLALVLNVIGGVIGTVIYSAIILGLLVWIFKKKPSFGPLVGSYLLAFLIIFGISFVLGLVAGLTGSLGLITAITFIAAIGGFVFQAWFVSQRVADNETGQLLNFGTVILAQLIVLAVGIVIVLILAAAFGGF